MAKRVLGVLVAALLSVLLWPSAAMACDVTYESGGGGAGCGGSAPLIGVAVVYGAVGVTMVTLSVLSFLRGRMTPDDLQAVLSSYLAGRPIGGPAGRIALKPAHERHTLNKIRPNSRVKERNTIVLPGTNVAKDLEDIRAGRGTWNSERNCYEVNGRTYGVEANGTIYPIAGPGLVTLSRSEYKVLKECIARDGDISAARAALRRDPSISDADWEAALEVFRYHQGYKGGA
jgi:hypothetical protein